MTQRLKGVPDLPFVPIVSTLYGGVAAILVFATPQWLFEWFVVRSGLPQLIPAATPPLGDTARILTAIALGIATIMACWPVLQIGQNWVRARRRRQRAERAEGLVIAPITANDAPETDLSHLPRRPIFAERDLGAPLMSDEALASADELLLEVPLADSPPIHSMVPDPEPVSRFHIPAQPVSLNAELREPAADETPFSDRPESVVNLLDRLERAMADKGNLFGNAAPPVDPEQAGRLRDTLGGFARSA